MKAASCGLGSEINLLIFQEPEMFHDLQVRGLGIFIFEPVPGFLGGFRLDLIPDPDI